MKKRLLVLIPALFGLFACNQPASSPASTADTTTASSDPVRHKLMEFAGSGATDCGRLDVHATEVQLKAASYCAEMANQKKQPFFVAYDMPGMTVGVAGSAEGKLFTVQSQGQGASAALTSGECPSQLRVASSGRVTCFAPGDMGSMSGSHAAGSMPPGTPNPHTGGSPKSKNP